jgi:hypothetical protein
VRGLYWNRCREQIAGAGKRNRRLPEMPRAGEVTHEKLVMMLAAASLLICAAPYGITDPTPDAAKKDKLEAAKIAEEKGDLARDSQQL